MPSQRIPSPVPATDTRDATDLSHPSSGSSDSEIPLTAAQKRLLWRPEGGADPVVARHWEQAVWDDFSLHRLRRAAAALARRHPLTRAQMVNSERQHLAPDVPPQLILVTDAASLDATEQRRRLVAECEKLCLTAEGALVQAWQLHVLQTGPDSAVITSAFARAFFDRTTIRCFLNELVEEYQRGEQIADGEISLGAFQQWARRTANEAIKESSEDATSRPAMLPGPDLPMRLGPDRARATTFARVTFRLEAVCWSAVRNQLDVAAPGSAPDALIFAAASSVLAAWTRSQQFSIPVIRDGRGAAGAAPTAAGQFDRLQVAAVDAAAPRTFAEGVVAWQRTLESGARLLPTRTSSGAEALVPAPVVFAFWRHPRPETARSHGTRSDHFVFIAASRPEAHLEIQAEETAEGALIVHFDHVRERFPEYLIEDMAASLERWLRQLAAGRDAWQLSPAEQAWAHFPTRQWPRRREVNATQGPVSNERLHDGFLRQCRETPHSPAIITPGRTLSYEDTYGYAVRLAQELQSRGVQRNELVAIATEKGWEQIVATLGISLAGAAYLPVDLELPQDRIRFLISHGDARVVVTTSNLASGGANALPVPPGVHLLAIDTLDPVGLQEEPPASAAEVQPDDLAYVIFTSGSTGTPKGVMIDHRGAVNTIRDMNARFGVGPQDRVLALSRLSFDLSVYDIFGLLAAGGALVVPGAQFTRDPAHWVELMRAHQVTIWDTVPALMQLLVDYLDEQEGTSPPAGLRQVWMSGDWIPLTLPERIRARWPDAAITSLGGATEASIWSILFPITAVDPAWRSIPYGKAMVNQTFHVLHENLAPCPELVTGELFIGGIGVARGYWKDEEKTNARFLVHPRTQERLYRTGDLGRFLPDGNIEFLGRADFQVKIRGFRIELGEIEAALVAHERVRAAVVVAHGASDEERRLVAHVVPEGEAPIPAAELQQFLQRTLPAYMVPSVFMFRAQLPLTANGKVDLKALPAPDAAGMVAAARPPHVAPTNEIEEILLHLWRPLLGTQHIGIDDDFFALGGTSLTGTRLIMRLRAAFNLPVPIQCLVENPTIRRLAAALEELLIADLAQE